MTTQLESLFADMAEIERLFAAHPEILQPLADLTDPNTQARYMVIADLFWQIWSLAMGISHLLEEELRAPLIPVERALFEAIATLGYLVRHERAQDEAVTFLAYSYIRELRAFPDQADLVGERKDLLARMPAHLVAEASRRSNQHPRTWSGRTVKDMAAGNVGGYEQLYGFMSAESHVSIVGQYMRVIREGPKARIETGRPMQREEIESHANFARRALHGSFRMLWNEFKGPPLRLKVSNPDEWKLQG